MEIKRDVYEKLTEWKNRSCGHTALMVEGARRIGKSTIVRKFAKENYKSFVMIDFANASRKVKDNFRDNLIDLDVFFQNLSLEFNTRLFRRESLIVFDEIQKFPRAREAIKYLVADGRYDFIETGSLISIKENVKDILVPSEEEKVKMHPVTFEEFLVADGRQLLLDYIRECYKSGKPLVQSEHQKAMRLWTEYLLVGGMPQSVVAFLENDRDFFRADREKRHILSLYRDDIAKASGKYNSRVSAIFENIPGFLSRHEKRVVLSKMGDGNLFSSYDEPMFWLGNSMICNLCYKCTDPNVGFALNMDEKAVKCYMGDTGLLVCLAFSEREIFDEKLYLSIMDGKFSLNKGMLYENMIAQMMTACSVPLFFYTHYSEEKKRNDIEVDFILTNNRKTDLKIFPLEVKSSKNYTTVSHDKFKSRFGGRVSSSYIVHPKPFSVNGDEYRIPPYMLPAVLG